MFLDLVADKLPMDLWDHKYKLYLDEFALIKDPSIWHGSVAMVFLEDSLIFIKRSQTMPSHRGQIAFIGGHKLAHEIHPVEVALREFEEETSLDSRRLENFGILPAVLTANKTAIIPVVLKWKGSVDDFTNRVKSNGEWDLLFQVKMNLLLNKKNWSYAKRFGSETNGKLMYRTLLSEEYKEIKNLSSKSPEMLNFWGASARMLWNLITIAER